jgi:hypothetical protein
MYFLFLFEKSDKNDKRFKGRKKQKNKRKTNKTVKTKLVLIVYLHQSKNAWSICLNFLCFKTEIIVILFSPFLPLPNKIQTLDSWVLAPSSGQSARSNVCERI